MSELTTCNYCTHQNTLLIAKAKGKKVTILREDFGLGGVGVYVHPKHVKIKELKPSKRKQYHVAWLMQLPKHCCC